MVVDAKIACAIDAFSGARGRAKLLDNKRSSLLPPAVTPCRLPRFKRRHHPLRERRRCLDERAPHSGKDVGAREHVSLHREPVLNEVARPLDAIPHTGAGDRTIRRIAARDQYRDAKDRVAGCHRS